MAADAGCPADRGLIGVGAGVGAHTVMSRAATGREAPAPRWTDGVSRLERPTIPEPATVALISFDCFSYGAGDATKGQPSPFLVVVGFDSFDCFQRDIGSALIP